jgi:hypothetical protein
LLLNLKLKLFYHPLINVYLGHHDPSKVLRAYRLLAGSDVVAVKYTHHLVPFVHREILVAELLFERVFTHPQRRSVVQSGQEHVLV